MRILIVSNRAPVSIITDGKKIHYAQSSGGLSTSLSAYVSKMKERGNNQQVLWIGWPGASVPNEEEVRKEILEKFGTYSVFITDEMIRNFYEGFCNNTIWPLFHYFPYLTNYRLEDWENYIAVNRIFCEAVLKNYQPDDIIWIHDYHLMLLPALIREKIPGVTIGFFLHIPFPSYEIYRLLPSDWRMNILKGIFGADLIGFHTHDYRTYFLRSSMRILGLSNNMGEVNYFNRIVKIDSFPMGIDYVKYNSAVKTNSVKEEIYKLRKNFGPKRLILSIDRQDYSKGILKRMNAFEQFLEQNPELRNSVMMILVVIPSRIGVEDYKNIKSSIDQLAGQINGTYGTLQGMPIIYQYRSLSFEELIALYAISDVALVTPLRDGMNLIAKEFIACKTDGKGVLILSEMAGSSDELTEAIIINPNNQDEVAVAIKEALMLDEGEQSARLSIMQRRLKEYDVFKWASDFLTALQNEKTKQHRLEAKILPVKVREKMREEFANSPDRMLFLDYDGTLQPFAKTPEEASPAHAVLEMLEGLTRIKNTSVILISGRDWQTLEKWFGHYPVNLVAEHGLFIRELKQDWRMLKPVRRNWKKKILSIMNNYSEKLPGALVEEKNYSISFHYRRSDAELAYLRVKELMTQLTNYTTNLDLQVMRGNKVIEVRNAGIDKGVAALLWLNKIKDSHFILAIGDDVTDEDLFKVIPPDGYSIKVGGGSSYAMYRLNSANDVLDLLTEITNEGE